MSGPASISRRILHRDSWRAARSLERGGVLARSLFVAEESKTERFWWPDRTPRIQLPRPPNGRTFEDLKAALSKSESLRPAEQSLHRRGRFVSKRDPEILRRQGCLLVSHPMHRKFPMFPVILACAESNGTQRVIALNQRADRTLGSMLPLLPSADALALTSCASAPLFAATADREKDPLLDSLTILTTCSELEHKREVLFVKGECVLYEALSVRELGDAIADGRCNQDDCKFIVGIGLQLKSLEEELAHRCWLSVIPTTPKALRGPRASNQSFLLSGVDSEDFEEWDNFSYAFWAEAVCSIVSGPGFYWLARYPCERANQAGPKGKRIHVPQAETMHNLIF